MKSSVTIDLSSELNQLSKMNPLTLTWDEIITYLFHTADMKLEIPYQLDENRNEMDLFKFRKMNHYLRNTLRHGFYWNMDILIEIFKPLRGVDVESISKKLYSAMHLLEHRILQSIQDTILNDLSKMFGFLDNVSMNQLIKIDVTKDEHFPNTFKFTIEYQPRVI